MCENIWSRHIWLGEFRTKALESDQGEVGLEDLGQAISLGLSSTFSSVKRGWGEPALWYEE